MPPKGVKPAPKGKPRAPAGMLRSALPDRTKKDPEPIPVEIWDYKLAGDGVLEAEVEVFGNRTRLANRKYATSTSSAPAPAKTILPTTANPGQTCELVPSTRALFRRHLLTLDSNCKGTCTHPEYWCRFLSLNNKLFCNKCGDFLRDHGYARPGPWNSTQSIHPPPILSIDDVVLPHDLALKLSDAAFETICQDHNTAVLRRTDTQEVMRTPPPEQLVEIVWKTLRIRKYLWKLMKISSGEEGGEEEGEEKTDEDVEMVDAPAEITEFKSNGVEGNKEASKEATVDPSIPLETDLKDQLTILEASELYKILAQQWSTAECDDRARWSNIDMWTEAAEKMNHKFHDYAVAAGVPLAPRLPNSDNTRQHTELPTARPHGIVRVTGYRLMALANQLSGPMQEIKSMYTELERLDEAGIPFSACFGCLDDADCGNFNHLAVAALEYQNADKVDNGI